MLFRSRIELSDNKVVATHLVGAYNAANVLAAICIGKFFGVDEDAAVAQVASGLGPLAS